jgi:hypothetical protein
MSLTAQLTFTGFSYDLSLGSSVRFTPGSPAFTGSINGVSTGAPPITYACTACSAQVNGAFFGAGAAFAGYAYKLQANQQTVTGVAVFKQ